VFSQSFEFTHPNNLQDCEDKLKAIPPLKSKRHLVHLHTLKDVNDQEKLFTLQQTGYTQNTIEIEGKLKSQSDGSTLVIGNATFSSSSQVVLVIFLVAGLIAIPSAFIVTVIVWIYVLWTWKVSDDLCKNAHKVLRDLLNSNNE
jgi:hypothetical protein